MENNCSIWQKTAKSSRNFRTLEQNLKTEVCVIGGGITGLSVAYFLSKAGKHVILLEKDKIASKTTGGTTGKITSQHHLFYDYLLHSQGKEFAKRYFKANQQAIDAIESIIQTEKIDCQFERKTAFVWTKNPGDLPRIQAEVDAIKALGEKAIFTNEIEVLGKIEGAIGFENQAQFHAVNYVNGLAKSVLENGGEIYENTKVVDYEKEKHGFVISCEENGDTRRVSADYVVVATRYPIFNVPGFYFLKMYQELEYGLALKTNQALDGMYVSCEVPTISYRTYEENGQTYLLLVGNGHKTGENPENNGFGVLEAFAKTYFPENEVVCRWNVEDTIGLDKIPYIGAYSEVRENMYVATGFKKWGMTTSHVAANLITDEILGRKNPATKIFDSTRLAPIKNREEMKNMLKEVGESMIMPRVKGEKHKKYCAHLGCEVSWNDVTKTWDCPCHGSRYEADGKLIEGPSTHDLD